jgi:hypothetical protein
MIIFLSIAFLVLLAGFATLVHALRHVVDGYEDDSGFYEGSQSVASHDTSDGNLGNAWGEERIPQKSIAHSGTFSTLPSK